MKRPGQKDAGAAIVGISCRFPGAAHHGQFWRNLAAERNSVIETPSDRWPVDQFYSPDPSAPGKTASKWGGFLENIDEFDHRFFNISPREARSMDPQQRLLLQEVWRCLEDAGVAPERLAGTTTGVYVGAMSVDYHHDMAAPGSPTDAHGCSGNYSCMISNRVSHFFGLRGPSLTIDTACSSSLAAIHAAMRALDSGEIEFALVGGVSLNFNPWKYISLSKARMLSPDGQCKAFDRDANGYVPGEGIGALLLRPVHAAREERNHIYGVVKGSAVNHGSRAVSLTAPVVEAQRDVVLEAWESAGLSLETCSYLEAHGTGTSLGDPIEVEALTQAFRRFTRENQFCRIGSVKTNIGHLEAAAGIAGVIKVLLMMDARQIPATLNIRAVNPLIAFEKTPFEPCRSLVAWESRPGTPPRAGVSSFGFGGVNGHVAIEAYDGESGVNAAGSDGSGDSEPCLFLLSAKTAPSLQLLIKEWIEFAGSARFARHSLSEVCGTLQLGRTSFGARFAAILHHRDDLPELLRSSKLVPPNSKPLPPALVFGTPGPEFCAGNLEWLRGDETFEEGWRLCAAAARDEAGIEIGQPWDSELRNAQPEIAPARVFALQYAAGAKLLHLFPAPAVISGEGDGFWTALATCGMAGCREAIRGFWKKSAGGAVNLAPPRLPFHDAARGGRVDRFLVPPACFQLLLEAQTAGEAQFQAILEHARALVSGPFTFRKNLESWNSYLAPEASDAPALLADGGSTTMRRSLLWVVVSDSLRKLNRKWNLVETLPLPFVEENELLDLLDDGVIEPGDLAELIKYPDNAALLETVSARASAHSVRIDPAKPYRTLRSFNAHGGNGEYADWLRAAESAIPGQDFFKSHTVVLAGGGSRGEEARSRGAIGLLSMGWTDFLTCLKQVWEKGVDVRWDRVPGPPSRKVSLPGYQFIGEKFWIRDKGAVAPARQPPMDRAHGRMVRVFDPTTQPVIRDHRIGGRRLLPAASMMLLALEIAKVDLELEDAPALTRVEIKRPGGTEGPLAVEASLDINSGEFKIEAAGAALCHGIASANEADPRPKFDLSPWLEVPAENGGGLYAKFQQRGYEYGPSLRVVESYRKASDEILFSFTTGEDRENYGRETAILDGALQAIIVAARIFGLAGDALYFPCGFDRVEIGDNFSRSRNALVDRRSFQPDQDGIRASIELFDEKGIRTAMIEGALFKAAMAFGVSTKTALPVSSEEEEPKAESGAPSVETVPFADSRDESAGTDPALTQESVVPENTQTVIAEIESVRGSLAELLAGVLQVKPQDIDAETDLREYGLDSVSLTEYAESIEQRIKLSVNPTLLFEHPTLRGLAGHLVKERAANAARSEQNRKTRTAPSPNPGESTTGRRVTPKAAPAPPKPPAPIVVEEKVETKSPAPIAPVTPPVIAPAPASPPRPPNDAKTGVAIIGIAGRFPGCPDVATFWRKLEACEDLVTEVPADRWDWRKHFGDPHKEPNKTLSKWGGFLSDIDKFDAAFFRISPKEAAAMDPQQRILLELAWQTIENSGQRPSALAGSKTGVFVGVCNDDYRELLEQAGMPIEAQTTTSSCFSIVPNRVSFVFDFHGPSVAIDTACSSSLVAMHQAVQAIKSGDCDMALAGGVNICCMPRRQISLGHAGMLAADGKCRTFDESASGYVRGEGAALVLLKPLDKALADGDPIYAVVKGTAVNHGGSANSLTAPNPNAQTELIKTAFQRAGFDPATVGFVETHGTGTALGDPIEIAALKKAFAQTDRNLAKTAPEVPYCGLGSLKTNIGHLESAAGVAGVIKTALALRHGRIPGTVHFRKLNPRIELENSPFYIVEKTIPWPARLDSDQRPLPRRAGVSSFGFGGVNAHMALEESPEDARPSRQTGAPGPAIFTFSTKSADRLEAQARSFIDWLRSLPGNQPNLDDTAWTLQTGREAFEHRLVVLAQSKSELLRGLDSFLRGDSSDGWIAGSTGGKGTSRSLGDGPEDQEFFKRLADGGKAGRLARFWAEGADVRWADLRPDPKPRRISLPTYSFARDRHWVSHAPSATPNPTAHPTGSVDESFGARGLNHRDGSVFPRTINAAEPVLRDHIVLGRPILPGMAMLEEARAAVETATGRAPTRLTDVIWIKPLGIQDDSCRFKILLQNAPGETSFEVWSGSQGAEARHASGKFLFDPNRTPPITDLDTVRHRCGPADDAGAIYESFASCHVTYGAYFKGLQEVGVNGEEFLAKIDFPADALAREGAMPPGVLDAAAQGALKWILDQGESGLYVPYSLESAEIHAKLEGVVFAHGRALQFDAKAGQARFHIVMVDEFGKPLIELNNFCARRWRKDGRNGQPSGPSPELSLMRSVWRPVEPVGCGRYRSPHRRSVIFWHADDFGFANQLAATLEAGDGALIELGRIYAKPGADRLSIDERSQADFERALVETGPVQRVVFLGGADARSVQETEPLDRAALDERSVLALLRLLRALATQEHHGKKTELRVLVANSAQVAVNDEKLSPWAAATVALGLAAAKEFPELEVRVVDFDPRELVDPHKAVAATLAGDLPGTTAGALLLRGGKFFRRLLQPVTLDENHAGKLPLREEGVWLIVGGAGGLGFEIAKFLAREHRAKLVLTGRRPANAEVRRQIEEISALGGEAIYCAGDATDAARMKQIVAEGHGRFGGFHGAVYSALVLRDLPIRQMDEAEFRAAFDPKAGGIMTLQEALEGEALELFLVFSSANSFLANAGQANYAAGCAFHDACASEWAARRGIVTRIVNWGFWGDTGAVALGGHKDRLARQGIFAITNAEGMSALQRVISGPIQQVVAAKLARPALEAIGFDAERTCRVLRPSPSLGDILAVEARAGAGPKPAISFASFFQRLGEIVAHRLLSVFQEAGFFREKQEVRGRLEIRAAIGVQPKFHPVFEALLDVLAGAGLVSEINGVIDITDMATNAASGQLTREIEDFRRAYSDANPYLALVDACLKKIPAVFRGEIGPLEVLFPNGSGSLVEAIYRNNAISDYFNTLAASSIETLLKTGEERSQGRPIRILEIGAGVGGTTAIVTRSIEKRGGAVEYTFTDLSPSLAQAARASFGARYPWMRFATLNIEESPSRQGFEPGAYDIVVATNVLHATRDLGETLGHVKSLLRRNGLLLLNEATRSQPYLTTTFGLLEGWWRATDSDSRISRSPLAKPSVWKSLLLHAGFHLVSATGDPEVPGLDDSCQTVFVAESDGVIEEDIGPSRSNQPGRSPDKKEGAPTAPVETGAEPASWGDVEAKLASIVAAATGVTPADIDADASFVDLGIDSIIGIGIINRINHELGLSLKATALFNHTCLAGLAGHIKTLPCVSPSARVATNPEPARPPAPPIDTPVKSPSVAQAISVENNGVSTGHKATESDRIAVIGMSGRFPGANNLDEFWKNLAGGACSIQEAPISRWGDPHDYYDADPHQPGKSYGKAGGFLEGIEYFDPLFFDLSPAEAEIMDPQQRLFLEECWKAVEDAGYSGEQLAGRRCGVFAGVSKGDYLGKMREHGIEFDARTLLGNETSIMTGRVAYHLNLKGPAIPVDTACSSSLVAMHLACRSILSGECEMALVGGVFIMTTPRFHIQTSKTLMLSPRGLCKTFDQGADGFVPGEGVAALVLKSLKKALEDGDQIHGVIAASAVNQDGRSNGIMAPNSFSQRNLIAEVHQTARLNPETITMAEAHGTGTQLGDPIEVEALTEAFRLGTDKSQFCALGSVKTNIGHTAPAAGLAGVLKVLLALRHGQIPPSLHFETANPHIDFAPTPFFVNTRLSPWEKPAESPRRGCVSSFGFSGTNAHLVLEEGPSVLGRRGKPRPLHLFCLSGKTRETLARRVLDLAGWLKEKRAEGRTSSNGDRASDWFGGDLSFTLNRGRSHFEWRLAAVAPDARELETRLKQWLDAGTAEGIVAAPAATKETPPVKEAAARLMAGWDPSNWENPPALESFLHSLADIYCRGAEIEWDGLYRGESRRRISAPTYPFERFRCWPWPESTPVNHVTAMARPTNVTSTEPPSQTLLTKIWSLRQFTPETADTSLLPHLLVCEETTGARVAAELRKRSGGTWIAIFNQERATRISEHEYAFPFSNPAEAVWLAKELARNHPRIGGLAHLAISADTRDRDERAPMGLIALYQQTLENWGPNNLHLLLVTQGLREFKNPRPSLAWSILAGFVRMLGAEHCGLRARSVDLDPAVSDAGAWATVIVREAGSSDPTGEVCHRAGERYAAGLEVIPNEAASRVDWRLDPAKVYVVTGGTGELGSEIAAWLARKGAKKLLLLGKHPLPARGDWAGIAAESPSNPAGGRIRRVLRLEKPGANVETAVVDLNNEPALTALMSNVRNKLGPIGGVIHCAGTVGSSVAPFMRKEAAEIEQTLAPKVGGVQTLARVLQEDPIEFFVLFSSVAGLVPSLGAGICDYAAANAFLDHFAVCQRSQGRRAFRSIVWPSWGETTMGKLPGANYLATGFQYLSTTEGLELFERAMSVESTAVILPCSVDRSRFSFQNLLWRNSADFDSQAGQHSIATAIATAPEASDAKPDRTRLLLTRLFSEELKLPENRINPDGEFGRMGVDSVLLAGLVRRIEGLTGQPLEPSLLLEHPTLNRLSARLAGSFPETTGQATLDETPSAQHEDAVETPRARANPARPSGCNGREIAVIGLACRFPGAEGGEEFWELLRSGRSTISEAPSSRWDAHRWYSPVPTSGKSVSKWGGFLDGMELFDAGYFGIDEDQARQMDPLARHFLEASVQAARHAGYSREDLWNSRTGVFVGTRTGSFASRLQEINKGTIVGIGQNFIAAQVAQHHHWRGPNLVIDTACSSSLAGLHFACQSLRAGDCDLALAGGVDLLLDEKIYLLLSEAKALSPDGKCHAFDAKANGYVPGEGCGAVMVKTLEKALADGDPILAVIRGSAINNDGQTMGITTPSLEAQEELVAEALERSGVSPETITCVEAHGTGTMIGDPIELKALSRAFGRQTRARQFCAIGSVKTNFGHLHSAAGIASFIKMVLALRHGFIPPTLNCETPNPRFDFANSPFYPSTGLRAWEPRGGSRRAGVSSFGFGGTNCHMVLEEFSAGRFPGFLPRRKSLPPVQFDRKRYWPDAPETKIPDMELETVFAEADPESFLVLEEVLGS